jgi:hypothetical protein
LELFIMPIDKIYSAPDPLEAAQLERILQHLHDDRYALLRHLHNDVYSPIDHLHNEEYSSIANGFQAGDIWFFARSTPRPGWIEANGAILLRDAPENAALWAEAQASGNIVTDATWQAGRHAAYSTGDGSTTFRIPHLSGRVLIGAGQGSGLSSRALGTVGGAETCSLNADQNGYHAHTYLDYTYYPTNNGSESGGAAGTNRFAYYPTRTTSYSGLGAAHNNMQPWAAVLVCIKL